MTSNLLIVTLVVFLMNIPFGCWRRKTKKFSLKWFLAVHIPVPFVILLRFIGNIGFALNTYLFLVSAFFAGQWLGSFICGKNIAASEGRNSSLGKE